MSQPSLTLFIDTEPYFACELQGNRELMVRVVSTSRSVRDGIGRRTSDITKTGNSWQHSAIRVRLMLESVETCGERAEHHEGLKKSLTVEATVDEIELNRAFLIPYFQIKAPSHKD